VINFDRLILGPAMAAFAGPFMVVPKDGSAVFVARGDFRQPSVEIALEDGSFTTSAPSLGVRRSEFLRFPRQEDEVYLDIVRDSSSPSGYAIGPASRKFVIVDLRPDGEGDVKLVLRENDPYA
jgi:hypothetical protein